MTTARPRTTAPTREVVVAAVLILGLGVAGAVQAGRAGASFMRDLEQDTPALALVPPALPPAGAARLARRVFLVIVDGLRYDRSYELPFLDELRRRGVDAAASSHYPTWSRPNYVSILTGVPPLASGVRTNHHAAPVPLDSLMDRVRAAGMRAASATDYDVLPRLFLRWRSPPLFSVPMAPMVRDDDDTRAGEAGDDPALLAAVRAPDANLRSPFDDARYAPWPGGFREAGSALVAGDAELVVLLLGATDAAGHLHGGASPAYRAAAEVADRALAQVLGGVDLGLDAIIVTADHGHTARGGHGGVEPEVVSVPLVVAGAGVVPGATPRDARLIDLAPTVAALLGLPAPGHGLGRTLTELLALGADDRARLEAADGRRLTVTRAVVQAAADRADRALVEHRAGRIALVALGALAAGLLAGGLVRRRALRLDVRLLAVTVPAFFVVYYALIGLLGQRFSPSLLPAQGHLAGTLLRYGLIGTAVQLAANLWGLRRQPSLADRLAAASGIAWVGLVVSMIPAGLLWAVFPPPYVTLPGPVWLVVIPAVQVAVASTAVTFALTLIVEVIVFAARAWHRPGPR